MIDRICSLIKMKKPEMNRGLLFASGTTVPADGTDNYQTGCVFQHTDGTGGTSFYVNEGSVTSCEFNAVTTGGPEDVLTIGAFSSLTAGSGIAISTTIPSAAVIYGDDNGLSIGDSVYNFRSRILLTVDQAGASIRAVCAQIKMIDGVDVATGIYAASQGYLELVGEHDVQAGANLSCVSASLEIGTSLTIDNGGEACGLHVETTGAGTITNNGTCAGILIDNAVGAAQWPVGIYMPGPDVLTGLRIGDWIGSAATTHGVMFGADMDVYADGQLDVMQVHGATNSLITGSYSAKCGRFRHVVQVTGTLEAEAYGLVGQVVAKTVVFGLYAAGLMGTIESNGGFHAGDGVSASYPCMAGVIARPGGSGITVDAGSVLAGFAALSNTNTSVTLEDSTAKYPGLYVSRCQAACIVWSQGILIDPLAVTQGIVIGAEEFGAAGTGIVVDGTALHSGCEFYFDDGGVAMTGYAEAFRVGFLVSTEITVGNPSIYAAHDYMYLAADVTTTGGVAATWASLLAKGGTVLTNAGIGDFCAIHATVDLGGGSSEIADATTVAGISFGGDLQAPRTGTGKAVAIRVRAMNGHWDGLFEVVDLDVATAKSGDGDGSIPIYVDGTIKYIQYWNSAS